MKFGRFRVVLALGALCFGRPGFAELPAADDDGLGPVSVSVNVFFRPNNPEQATTRRLLELVREDTSIELEEWGGIELPGGGAKASLMMSIAGKTAPDLGEAWRILCD